jgi:hypothetical protein
MASPERTVHGDAALQDDLQRGRKRNPLSAITNQGSLAPSFVNKTPGDISAPSTILEKDTSSFLGDQYGVNIKGEQGMPNRG